MGGWRDKALRYEAEEFEKRSNDYVSKNNAAGYMSFKKISHKDMKMFCNEFILSTQYPNIILFTNETRLNSYTGLSYKTYKSMREMIVNLREFFPEHINKKVFLYALYKDDNKIELLFT